MPLHPKNEILTIAKKTSIKFGLTVDYTNILEDVYEDLKSITQFEFVFRLFRYFRKQLENAKINNNSSTSTIKNFEIIVLDLILKLTPIIRPNVLKLLYSFYSVFFDYSEFFADIQTDFRNYIPYFSLFEKTHIFYEEKQNISMIMK